MIEEPARLTIKRTMRRPTADQIAAFQGVPTGFVVDAMDGSGALSHQIQPVGGGVELRNVAAGPALTADCGPGDFLAVEASLKFIQSGDIVVGTVAGHQGCAAVGDRILGMMKNCGAAGFVTDGPARDYDGIVQVGLPLWCTGLTPASPVSTGPGRLGFAIQIGAREVETGDMIVGDRDGVVVVPFELLDNVIERLKKIKTLEKALDAEVANGLKFRPRLTAILESSQTVYRD
jgi:4-hydroxy-4-methyl-2-oxoglutarate aldolase